MMIIDGRSWTLSFDFDDSDLNSKASSDISDIFDYITYAPQYGLPIHRIVIVGYTDTAGPDGYNIELSKARAIAVADALVAAGVPHDLIAVDWKGEGYPAVATGDNVPEARNRRVTVDPT